MAISISKKSRPKYVTDLLVSVNERLRTLKVKDERNDLFRFMCNYLSKKGLYRGYNYYCTEKDMNGKDVAVLAGLAKFKKGEWEYLQIW